MWKQRRRGAAKPLPRPVIPTGRKRVDLGSAQGASAIVRRRDSSTPPRINSGASLVGLSPVGMTMWGTGWRRAARNRSERRGGLGRSPR